MVDSDDFETKSEDEDEDLVPQIGPRKRYGEQDRPNGKKHKSDEVIKPVYLVTLFFSEFQYCGLFRV